MSPKMNLGINFVGDQPMKQVLDICSKAEDSGFEWIGVVDSQLLGQEFYVSYTAYIMSTSHAKFVPMVSNVLTRHPSVTAAAMASLYELGPGRVILGIASGDSAVYGIGLNQAKVEYIRQYVKTVKGLLNGEEVTWEGKTFRHERKWQEPIPVKVFIASGGAKTVKMASQVADGLILNTGMGASAECVQYVKNLVKEGAEEVGRNPDDLDLWWHLSVNLAESREAALDNMGGMGVWFMTRATMEGKLIPEKYKGALLELDKLHNTRTHGVPKSFATLAKELGVFDFLVDRAGDLNGNAKDITKSVEQLYDNGIRNLMFYVPPGQDKISAARSLGNDVLPHFR